MKILNFSKVVIGLTIVSSLTFASNNLNFSQEELRELGKSCKNANTTFLTGYGTMYHYGLGQEKDIIKAIRLYQKSCDCNEYEACNNLGTIYEGEDGIKKDYKKARELYKKACDGDYALGCYNLGNIYYDGKGVKQDIGKGAMYFKESCDTGNNWYGCYNFAVIAGKNGDHYKAKEYFVKACSLGKNDLSAQITPERKEGLRKACNY